MTAPLFKPKQVQYIIAQYARGRSSRCIAREMGTTQQTILLYLEKNGVERRVGKPNKVVTVEMVQMAKDMRVDRKRWKTIVAKIGVSYETLRVAIKNLEEGKPV